MGTMQAGIASLRRFISGIRPEAGAGTWGITGVDRWYAWRPMIIASGIGG